MSAEDRKQLKKLREDAKAQKWRVKENGYLKLLCPCPDKHMKLSVHLTPKRYYWQNLRKWLVNNTCWKEES